MQKEKVGKKCTYVQKHKYAFSRICINMHFMCIICLNMHNGKYTILCKLKYAQNMQQYAVPNMQEICTNTQNMCIISPKICINMNFMCRCYMLDHV